MIRRGVGGAPIFGGDSAPKEWGHRVSGEREILGVPKEAKG